MKLDYKIDNKAQMSVETIIILGLLLLAVIILAIFFLGNLNKSVNQASELENTQNVATDPLKEAISQQQGDNNFFN